MILSDIDINYLSRQERMISPFTPTKQRALHGRHVPSYGQSSFGYDITLSNTFLLPVNDGTIDPMGDSQWRQHIETSHVYRLQPRQFVLAASVETFQIPENVLGVVYSKSTYARCGLVMTMTPLEPNWAGTLTLEIGNLTDSEVLLYIGAGIAQLVFFQGDTPHCSYVSDSSIYQGTVGVVPAGEYKIIGHGPEPIR